LTLQALEKLDLDAATAAVQLNNSAAEGMAEASLGAQPKARLKEALRRLDALMEKAAGPSQTVAAALQTRLSSRQQETILCNR
jgi:sulfur carrier protein ThiS